MSVNECDCSVSVSVNVTLCVCIVCKANACYLTSMYSLMQPRVSRLPVPELSLFESVQTPAFRTFALNHRQDLAHM